MNNSNNNNNNNDNNNYGCITARSSLLSLACGEFIDRAASSSAVPGGGGVSALVGALAASLGHMTGALTVGKKKYADVELLIKETMQKAEMLMDDLKSCVDLDAEAFEPLSRIYSLPKDTPDYDRIKEEALRDAAAVPYRVMELCAEMAEVLRIFADNGSRLVISDSATGAALLRGAMYGAAINVKVNTRLMKDREYADELDRKVDELRAKYSDFTDRIYEDVMNILS